eukprot:PITA_03966
MNPALKDIVKEELQKLLDARFTYSISDSEWVSPLVLVPRKNGKSRICVDYEELKKKIKKDHFSLPFIDQVLDGLAGKKFFSFLDGFNGYTQSILAQMTRIRPPSPVLGVFSLIGSFLSAYAMPLPLSRGTILGHSISQKGLRVDPNKIAIIQRVPPPQKQRDVRNFLGLAGYYRIFIKYFNKLASPLFRLLAKDFKFLWSEICQDAWDTLKEKLTTATILQG